MSRESESCVCAGSMPAITRRYAEAWARLSASTSGAIAREGERRRGYLPDDGRRAARTGATSLPSGQIAHSAYVHRMRPPWISSRMLFRERLNKL